MSVLLGVDDLDVHMIFLDALILCLYQLYVDFFLEHKRGALGKGPSSHCLRPALNTIVKSVASPGFGARRDTKITGFLHEALTVDI